jgi:hypothetical protein
MDITDLKHNLLYLILIKQIKQEFQGYIQNLKIKVVHRLNLWMVQKIKLIIFVKVRGRILELRHLFNFIKVH